MAFESRPNSGSAFKNRRANSDKSPHLTGSLLIDIGDGQTKDFWLNVWIKQDKNGDDYISVSVNERQPMRQPERGEITRTETPRGSFAASARAPTTGSGFSSAVEGGGAKQPAVVDDDIPF